VNAVVARLTAGELLGRRRGVVLVILPAVMLLLAVLARSADEPVKVTILTIVAFSLVVPLLGLVLGTGAIASEIDDGSIVYLLAKPMSRYAIATTKVVVAAAVTVALAAVPTWAAALVLGLSTDVAIAFALAAALAGICYAAAFVLLSVATRSAVVFGLLYALVWEGVVGGFVPGARVLSVQQWALGVAEGVLGPAAAADIGLDAAVGATTGLLLMTGVTLGATWYAGQLLRTLRVTGDG